MENYKRIAMISWAAVAIALLSVFGLYVIAIILPILTPFIYATAIVYILRPVVEYLERRKFSRTNAVIVAFLLLLLIIMIFALLILPPVVSQTSDFVADFPGIVKQIGEIVESYEQHYKNATFFPYVLDTIDKVSAESQNIGKTVLSNLIGLTSSFVGGLLNFILGPFIAFYILKDYDKIKTSVLGLVPAAYRDETRAILRKVDVVMAGFLKGQIIIAFIVGVLTTIALWVLGVKYSLVIGMITGLFNIVPYFGAIIGGGLAFVVALFQSWQLALWTLLVFFIIQQVESLVLSPNIMASSTDIHPTLIIFALTLGAFSYGIFGMLLAIPLAAGAKAVVVHFQEKAQA